MSVERVIVTRFGGGSTPLDGADYDELLDSSSGQPAGRNIPAPRHTSRPGGCAAGGVDMDAHGASDWRQDYVRTHPGAQPWALAQVPDLSEQLGAIDAPVLLVWATCDPISPLAVAPTLASRIRMASLVTFESDDHWVVHQYADETAAAVRAFVDAGR